MLYTPTELEEDLRVPARTVREWIRKGLPHQRDVREHILIDLQLSPNDRHRQAFQIGDKLFECQQARAVCFGRSDDRGGKAMPGEQRQMYRPKFTAITSI